jgi:hypothetical protein
MHKIRRKKVTVTRSEYPESIEDRLPIEETDQTIASDKVEGTAVYDANGDRIGKLHNFMVDKRFGKVVYAVMSFGGLLGLGESYRPLPWSVLRYDEKLEGYVVGIDMDMIRSGPSYAAGSEPRFDQGYYGSVYGHYGLI